jgi:hypothetical protein
MHSAAAVLPLWAAVTSPLSPTGLVGNSIEQAVRLDALCSSSAALSGHLSHLPSISLDFCVIKCDRAGSTARCTLQQQQCIPSGQLTHLPSQRLHSLNLSMTNLTRQKALGRRQQHHLWAAVTSPLSLSLDLCVIKCDRAGSTARCTLQQQCCHSGQLSHLTSLSHLTCVLSSRQHGSMHSAAAVLPLWAAVTSPVLEIFLISHCQGRVAALCSGSDMLSGKSPIFPLNSVRLV